MNEAQLFEKLHEALISAYPNKQDLEMMVRFKLNETLSVIVDEGHLSYRIFKLREWCNSNNKIEELIMELMRQILVILN